MLFVVPLSSSQAIIRKEVRLEESVVENRAIRVSDRVLTVPSVEILTNPPGGAANLNQTDFPAVSEPVQETAGSLAYFVAPALEKAAPVQPAPTVRVKAPAGKSFNGGGVAVLDESISRLSL